MHPGVTEYFEQFDSQHCEMLMEVRNMIVQAHPAVEEKFIYQSPFYSCNGYLCYLVFNKKRKRFVLGFTSGHLMADPEGLLRADDGQEFIRHLVIEPNQWQVFNVIPSYLQMAIDINLKKTSKNKR